MKFSINVKYHVTKNGYTTGHESCKTYYADDAAICLVSHIQQIAADTHGAITDIQASACVDHSPACIACGEPIESDCNYCDECMADTFAGQY